MQEHEEDEQRILLELNELREPNIIDRKAESLALYTSLVNAFYEKKHRATILQPGEIITMKSGTMYRVAKDGSWRRI